MTQRIRIKNTQNTDTHIDFIGWKISQSRWDLSPKETSKDVTSEAKIWKYIEREDFFHIRKHDYGITKC